MSKQQMLSDDVPNLNSRYSRILASIHSSHPSKSPGFTFIYQWQTRTGGLVVLGLTLLTPLTILIAPQIVLGVEVQGSTTMNSYLPTLSEISAGLAGALLAIVVFSIQLHAQRDREAALLTRFLVKKQLIPWIVGFAIGWSTFNIILTIVLATGFIVDWRTAFSIEVIGFLILLLSTYWLIYEGLHDASIPTFEIGLPLLESHLARLVALDEYRIELQHKFHEEMSAFPGQFQHFAIWKWEQKNWRPNEEVDEIHFQLTRTDRNEIVDVDMGCFNNLVDQLKRIESETQSFEALLFAAPGIGMDGGPVLVLRAAKVGQRSINETLTHTDDTDEQSYEVAAKTLIDALHGFVKSDIQNLLDRLFQFKNTQVNESSDIVEFFKILGSQFRTAAKNGESLTLKQLVEKYERFLEMTAYSHDLQFKYSGERLSWKYSLSNPLELEFSSVIGFAIDSKDQETVSVLIKSFVRYFHLGTRHESVSIQRWSLELLAIAYHRCITRPDSSIDVSALGKIYDDNLFGILVDISSGGTVNRSDANSERIFFTLKFVLQIIASALDANQEDHLVNFVDRLGQFGRHPGPHERYRQVQPLSEHIDYFRNLAMIVALGLALDNQPQSYSGGKIPIPLGATLIREIRKHLPNTTELVALWEYYKSSDNQELAFRRLGSVSLEDRGTSLRAGRPTFRYGTDWCQDGFIAALLLAASGPDISQLDTPPAGVWDATDFKDRIKHIASRQELVTSISNGNDTTQKILEIIEERCDQANRTELTELATIEVDKSRVLSLVTSAFASWKEERHVLKFIEKSMGNKDAKSIEKNLEFDFNVPLFWLTSSNVSLKTLENAIQQHLVFHEESQLLSSLEEQLDDFSKLDRLDGLARVVLAAKQHLIDNGKSPDVLLLPKNERFLFSLFQRPLWEIFQRGQASSVGNLNGLNWEGLRVEFWPFTNPTSVLVFDTHTCFGPTQKSTAEPNYEFILPSPDERSEFESKITSGEFGDYHVARDELVSKLSISLETRVGVADEMAGVKIDISASNANYAILANGKTYHRPWCRILSKHSQEDINLTLAVADGDGEARKPCQVCKPEKWDIEADMGDDQCLGP